VSLKAWLKDSAAWRWVLFWLIVPNIVIVLMWPIGGPPMHPSLLLFGCLALAAAQLPWTWAKRAILLVMMLAITAYYVCLTFNLPFWGISHIPSLAGEIKPWRAPFYVAGLVIFLAALGLAMRFAPRVPRFRSRHSLLIAALAVNLVGFIDYSATASTKDSYSSVPGPGDPFTSAAWNAGLDRPGSARNNLVIIVVEALGTPAGEVERGLLESAWNRPAWRSRYAVERGYLRYYGSTTNAELRELCGQWGVYSEFDFAAAECLPQIYEAAGYETSGMHSFTSNLFERASWYPKLGFDRIEFAPELKAAGVLGCGGIFPGACDDDVPRLIGERLKAADKPQFVYWLTLNSHLPVLPDRSLGTEKCRIGPPAWRDALPDVCRLFAVHRSLADAIDRLAMDPALPPTDFLIVGDHVPAFFDRENRLRFDPNRVPWFLLRAREEADFPGV